MSYHRLARSAARPADLKLNNRIQILDVFKSGGVYSVAEIAGRIGISRQTVMKAIQFFLEKGIIVSDGKAASGSMGGKRAELFTLSANRCLMSVLISPDGVVANLFNFRCEVIDTRVMEVKPGRSVEEAVEFAAQACEELMRRSGIPSENVYGVCVAVPGIVERGASCVRYSALFPDWGFGIPLGEMLANRLGGMRILVENVSKVCGRACLQREDWQSQRCVTIFSAWGGLSASQIAYGLMLDGKDSLIGEIGHMTVAPEDEEPCACGGHGCFERQVSARRLGAMIEARRAEYAGSPLLQRDSSEIGIKEVFDASRAGDPLGRELSAYVGRFFALALHNLTLTFNPDRVLLQGDYAEADDCFMETVLEELGRFRYRMWAEPFALEMDRRPVVELTTLGAYTLLIDRLFSDEMTYS